ncbi:MAG TPA: crosslink repair DNA glycosylase YcaQ family protein, partial [Candidatus Limnocylindria bacterium]
MTLRVSWQQALAWRMRRHFLDPLGKAPIGEVVSRLCGVQAQVASSAELAIRLRQQRSSPGEVADALASGDLIKTWAMRGTLHYLNPEDAGIYLSLLAAGRSWEVPSWQKYFGLRPADFDEMWEVAWEALDGKVLTREALGIAITQRPKLRHLRKELASGWGSLFKPLAWRGELCFGPSQGNRVTFMRPDQASSRWAGVPEPDEAAPRAIKAYLGAYGPATIDHFGRFISRGRVSKRSLRAWFSTLGGAVAEVQVDDEVAYVLAEHVDALAAAKPSKTVRLLGGFDQWVLGPGTEDPHVLPQAHRRLVSKQSGWIAPLVVAGGVVAGTWEL